MMVSLLVGSSAVYGSLCLFLYVNQKNMVFFPATTIVATPSDFGMTHQSFTLALTSSTVTGWVIEGEPDSPWVLHCNGNAGNISGRLEHAALLKRFGFNSVFFDYRGFGKSEGTPTEDGLLEDAQAVRAYLREQHGVESASIVYFGESLGGAVAAALAEKDPPAGLILKSTFTSVPDLASELYPIFPVRLLARYRFPTIERIPRFDFPILICHGPGDEIVGVGHGERLYQAAQGDKEWLELPGDHNTGPLALGSEFASTVQRFVVRTTDPQVQD